MLKRFKTLFLLVAGLSGLDASASSWEWGGFGTISTYRSDAPGVAVRPDPLVARAAQSGEWRSDADSRLGLQGRWRLDGGGEWVAQMEASDEEGGRWRPRLEWAFFSIEAAPGLRLRLGRQVLPTLRHSETRNVGFAQASVRPPMPVYSLNPGTRLDGLNASWEQELADGTLRLDAGAGRASLIRNGRPLELRRSMTAVAQWQRAELSLRASIASFALDLDSNPLATLAASGLCANCAELQTLRGPHRGVRGQLYSVLLAWEGESWQATVELLERPAGNSVHVPPSRGWYVLLSHRAGAWQPHVAFGELRNRSRPLGLQAPPGATAQAAGLLAAFDRLLQAPNDLRSLQIGLRWDLDERWAIKLQTERWKALRDRETGRTGLVELSAPPLSTRPSSWDGRVRLTTLSLDFVF